MKKHLIIFSLSLFTVIQLNGQTNTFPASGNVGIGALNPSHELVVQGSSSPNIELKNSNYSNGGFVINRTNYGNQWKWWAQSNVMYFGFATDETNFSNKLTIKSNGNTGIGNTSPQYKLDVTGDILFTNSNYIRTKNSSGSTTRIHGINSSNIEYIGAIDQNVSETVIGTTTDFLNLRTNSISAMYINNNQNIGIGTTLPDSKLTVKGHVNIGGDGNYHLKTRHIDGKHFSNSTIHDLHLNWNTGKHVLIGFGGQDSNMYVSGNLGIGTTTPDAKLAVKGNIHTNEVKVDLLGAVAPDYVFYKDYDLKTLNEVENYIAKEGYLPNIPSAKEMETNGLLLKEMNLKLLEKIEELTLYTIQQEKEINTLKKKASKVEVLEERLQKIEALLNSIKQ